MRWSVYVDLARHLDDAELAAVSAALDDLVPDGGCTTPRTEGHELFFVVEAASSADAHDLATRYTGELLADAKVQIEFEVTATPARDSEPRPF